MFEASMNPGVLERKFQYLRLEERIHTMRTIRVASRRESSISSSANLKLMCEKGRKSKSCLAVQKRSAPVP
ncbi:hypothetical protein [Paraburkholderia dilworthii]|uniref:hypothetical protein n=1 Tax=Paraburkholderia dilworthii TaxID=948106 RepID=UPI0012B5D815|nr:hypothetical protein [Paraburkholderia dilworthii]